jgi:heme-degrading monooxygenase HmoA
MLAVIFEVELNEGRTGMYLDAAASLRPHLEQMDGFLSIERFESLSQPGKLLSLSFWRDEAAIERWRTLDAHRRMQTVGREVAFAGYRLRIAQVVRDYGMDDRAQAPEDSRAIHEQRAPKQGSSEA